MSSKLGPQVARDLQRHAMANPLQRATDGLLGDFFRGCGREWSVGLSVNY